MNHTHNNYISEPTRFFFSLNYKLSFLFFLVFSLLATVLGISIATAVKEEPVKNECIVWGNIGAVAGFDTFSIRGFIEKYFKVAAQKTGCKFKSTFFPDKAEKFRAGKIDFALLYTDEIINFKKDNVPVVPFITYTIDNKKTNHDCMYVSKQSGITKTSDLKGKTIGEHLMPSHYAMLRKMLKKEGEDIPLDKFFGKSKHITSAVSGLYSIILKEIDAVFEGSDEMKVLLQRDKKFKDIVPVVCTEEYTNNPIVYREGINHEVIEKLTKLALNAHKDKDFEELWMFFYAMNGHIVSVSDSEYESIRSLDEEAEKRGWYTEYENFRKH